MRARVASIVACIVACAEPPTPAIAPIPSATTSASSTAAPDASSMPSASATAIASATPPRPPDPVDLKDQSQLDVALTATPARLVAGATTTLTLTIRNPDTAPLRFGLYGDDLNVEVIDARGKKIEPPADPKYVDDTQCGLCPSMSTGGAVRGQSRTIEPGGTTTMTDSWSARRRAYPAVVRRTYPSCCMPTGDPPRDLGPLPLGTYTVRASPRIASLSPKFVTPVVETKVEVVAK